MAFPTTPLPVSVWLAPGGDPADATSWPWEEITADVRVEAGIEITHGRQDEGQRSDPTQVKMTLDNRAGNYTPRNPMGKWFGRLGKATPLQVRVTRMLDVFGRTVSPGLGTDADSGFAWSTPVSSAFAVNGANATCTLASNTAVFATVPAALSSDVDITYAAWAPGVATGAAWVSAVLVRYGDTSNHYRLHTEFSTSGTIGVKVAKVVAGVLTDLTSLVDTGVPYVANTKIRTRAQAFGNMLRVKAWADGSTEPVAWGVSVEDNTFPWRLLTGMYQWRLSGSSIGSISFDEWRVDPILATTFVSEWPARWDQSSRDATTPIVGSGILRRLRQGTTSLKSPIRTYLLAQGPGAYWPCEDGSDSQTIASAVANVQPAVVSNVSFAADDDLLGSDAVVELSDFTSQISGTVNNATAGTTGYGAFFFCRFPSMPVSDVTIAEIYATGTVWKWTIIANATGLRLVGVDTSGATIVSSVTSTWSTFDPTKWAAYYLTTDETAGTVTYTLKAHTPTTGLIWTFLNSTYSGSSAGRRTAGFRATGQTAAAYGHFWLGHNTLGFNGSDFAQAAEGYLGEQAHARLTRLCQAQRVPISTYGRVSGNTDLASTPMGRQRSGTFVAQLEQIEDTEQGLLIERGAGLAMRVHAGRYLGVTVQTLDFNQGHVAEPPEPADDDQGLRNSITLTREGGSSYTITDPSSIALDGEVTDEITVNTELDAQLSDHAHWRLAIGTIDELRWPRIVMDLAARPALITARCDVHLGWRLSLTNPPGQLAGTTIDATIEGWTETLKPYDWTWEVNCSPANPWAQVGTYDSTSARRDSASTSLIASQTTTSTSWSIRTTNVEDVWSTTAVPYNWSVNGETVTVTAMTARSGTGPYTQTATVTRSVNGVVKAQPLLAQIHLATPKRYAL